MLIAYMMMIGDWQNKDTQKKNKFNMTYAKIFYILVNAT